MVRNDNFIIQHKWISIQFIYWFVFFINKTKLNFECWLRNQNLQKQGVEMFVKPLGKNINFQKIILIDNWEPYFGQFIVCSSKYKSNFYFALLMNRFFCFHLKWIWALKTRLYHSTIIIKKIKWYNNDYSADF